MSDRNKGRVEETILELVAQLLLRRVKDPRVADVSPTRVDVSRDYSVAKIYYNLIGGGGEQRVAEASAGLASCRGFIRGQVKRQVRLRTIPELVFLYDVSLDRAMHIEELLEKIQHDDPEQSGSGAEPRGEDDE